VVSRFARQWRQAQESRKMLHTLALFPSGAARIGQVNTEQNADVSVRRPHAQASVVRFIGNSAELRENLISDPLCDGEVP
jgi:hypothetical protein